MAQLLQLVAEVYVGVESYLTFMKIRDKRLGTKPFTSPLFRSFPSSGLTSEGGPRGLADRHLAEQPHERSLLADGRTQAPCAVVGYGQDDGNDLFPIP